MGFLLVALYTNGTMGITTDADVVFVSLDGPREINDAIRGRSFDRALASIRASVHPTIIANFTISPRNEACIEAFCSLVSGEEHLKGVFFYFVTPAAGNDELVMPFVARLRVVERLLRLRREGAPVLNSDAALRRVARDAWARPSELCVLYAEGRAYRCCRSIGDRHACANCGYLGYAELESISHLAPGAIAENLRVVLPARRRKR